MKFSAFRRAALLGLIWSLGAVAVFYLPWRAPVSRPIDSDSYAVGFSNIAALLGLGITLLALFWFHWTASKGSESRHWNKQLGKLFSPFPVARHEYLLPFVFALIHCAAMWFWYRKLITINYGEMGYTVSRLELVLMGHVPYRDFEWNYGPLLLYFPALFVRLSNYRISSDLAYIISLFCATFFSFGAVYFTLCQLRLTRWQRMVIFLLLCSTFNLALGVNGTHMRFILPYFALFLLRNRYAKLDASNTKERIAFLAMMAGFIALCFLISPEIGVIFGAGIGLFCAFEFWNGARWLGSALFLAPLVSAASVLGFSRDYARSMASFGGGAANFPVVPSASILFYLFSIALVVPLLSVDAARNRGTKSALYWALAGMMTLFSAPALGRCDVGHVFYNGMGLFLIGLALFARLRLRFQAYPALFFLFFTLAYPFAYFFHYSPIVSETLQKYARGVRRIDRNFLAPSYREKDPQMEKLAKLLTPLGRIGTPLGVGENVEIMLKHHGLYLTEYFPLPSLEVRTEPQLQRKLADISGMKTILVEAKRLKMPPFNARRFESNHGAFVTQAVLYPLSFRLKHLPLFPEREIVRHINSRFRAVARFGDYLLLQNTPHNPETAMQFKGRKLPNRRIPQK